MASQLETIHVEVSNRILWIGPDAYPLSNIDLVRATDLVPDRSRLIRRFIRSLVGWGFLGLIITSIIFASGSKTIGTLFIIGVLAFLGYRLYQLLDALSRHLKVLLVHTNGGQRTGIASPHFGEIENLRQAVTRAISDATFTYRTNIQVTNVGGDQINMAGKENIGKLSV